MPTDRILMGAAITNGPPRHKVGAAPLDLSDDPAVPQTVPVVRGGPPSERVANSVDLDLGPRADGIVIQLDNAHGRLLHGFVMRMGLSHDQAEDAVQEVLVRLWSTIRSGQVVADPKAWAFRSIYRLAMDAHRWQRRMDAIRERLRRGSGDPTTSDVDSVERMSIWVEVDRLPPRQREILYLRYRADMTFEEAAGVMRITPGAARANATKAIKTLRKSVTSRGSW